MQSKRALLIAALRKLYRKRISIEYAQGTTLKKDKQGDFILIAIDGSLLTLQHIASGKRSYHFVDAIQIDLPERNRLNQRQKKSPLPSHP